MVASHAVLPNLPQAVSAAYHSGFPACNPSDSTLALRDWMFLVRQTWMSAMLSVRDRLPFDSQCRAHLADGVDNDGLLRILARAIPNLDYLYLELDEHNSFSNTGASVLLANLCHA